MGRKITFNSVMRSSSFISVWVPRKEWTLVGEAE